MYCIFVNDYPLLIKWFKSEVFHNKLIFKVNKEGCLQHPFLLSKISNIIVKKNNHLKKINVFLTAKKKRNEQNY
ncbi:MAG: hypothetical protein Kow0068_00640 [Marinilabiliales bacterium]